MNEIEAIRWHIERCRAMLTQRIDRLYNALEELQRTTLLLFHHDVDSEKEIDRWLSKEGFGVDDNGFYLSLPLLEASRKSVAPADAISMSWGQHLRTDVTARRHMYAHRGMGPHLKHLHERLGDVGWIYYQDASNTALQYPYIDQRTAIASDFNWSSYHTYVSVCPENNPERSIRWTPPTFDYAGEGMILSVSIPVWRENTFIGLWSIDLPMRYLYRDFDSSKPLPHQLQFIVNREGMLILHEKIHADLDPTGGSVSLHALKELGGEWASLNLRDISNVDDEVLRVVDDVGTVWVMCHARVPGVEWILFSGMPESAMQEEAARRLRQAFQQVGDGNFSHRIAPDISSAFLSSLAEEFNRMSLRLEQAESQRKQVEAQLFQAQRMESIGRLAGGVAHDYNNMLNVILGYTELALEKMAEGDALHNNLQEIYTAARRSMDITRQLLAFARCQPIAPRILDLNRAVAAMLKILRRLIGEDIELIWSPGEQRLPIKIDPTQIDQILANLCVNARDAITGVGNVTIETAVTSFDDEYCALHTGFLPGEYALLSVSDDGVGMDSGTISKIFEPFFTTKEMGRGTGLGLATVYGIVKQNNGFINVYSEPGRGSTFKIYLPRYAGEPVAVFREPAAGIVPGRGETLLLVEDETSILKLGREMLKALGYHVLTAKAPAEALAVAEKFPGKLDLLITDVIMPEMNGRDLAARLQALHADIKVLFMSGYTANIIVNRGMLEDNENFIPKPFSKKDLAAKVRQVLDQKEAGPLDT